MAIEALLPEGAHPDPALINSNIFVQFTQGSNNNMSVTYLQSIAANTNRMGYASYSVTGGISNPVYAIQRTNPTWGSGCLIPGDTWQFGPFSAETMLIFFLDSSSQTSRRYWSYFNTGITNPTADVQVCGAPGCTHSAWAYLPAYDLTIFGWEDAYPGLGDADYNDLVFFLTLQGNGYYNQVTPYENGTLLICLLDTLVSWNSFTDVDCVSWGLLETASGSSSCLTYMSIPPGWTWAPNDATSRAIIKASAQQWSYTGTSTCYILSVSATVGIGYNVSATGELQACTAPLNIIGTNGTAINLAATLTSTLGLCYNTGCNARFVLKSLVSSVVCAAVTRCNTTLLDVSLSITPSLFSTGVVTLPSTQTLYLSTGTGSALVTANLQLNVADLLAPKIDVVVLTDFYVDYTGSGQGQRSYIDSSWSTIGASFRSLSLNAQFAVYNFVPTSNSATAGFSITSTATLSASAFNFPDAAFHTISCGTTAAATLQRGRNLVAAINQIATSNALNWRSDSYRVIWIHSLCQLPSDGSSSATPGSPTLRSIQQLTGLVPIIANGAVSTTSITLTANIPWQYSGYYSGSAVAWDSPFRSYSFLPVYRGAFLMTTIVKTFQVVPSQGAVEWFQDIPQLPLLSSLLGAATIPYRIRWPSSVPSNTTALYFAATVQIIGRGTISYLIYFNHAPTLAPYSAVVLATQVSITFTLTPSDPDQGNLLNLIVLIPPLKGILTLGATAGNPNPLQLPLLIGATLDVNVFTLKYTPIPLLRFLDFTETITIAVSDGCATSITNVTINCPKTNQAPTATSFSVNMTEDQLASGSFSFAPYMSDPENGTLTPYLNSPAYVSSGTVSLGSLTTASGTSPYSSPATLPSGNFVYRLKSTNGFTGYGTIVIPFQAYDGALYSPTAYITINIVHANHAPTLSFVSSVPNTVSSTAVFAISVSDADSLYPGETAAIQIIGSSWGIPLLTAYSVDNYMGGNKITYSGSAVSAASPFNFTGASAYASGSNITISGNMITFGGFQWVAPMIGAEPFTQTITIRAVDASGAFSTTATLSFVLGTNNPPVWKQFPGALSPSQPQGSQWDGLYFSASSLNGASAMGSFVFTVISGPSKGIAYLEDGSGNTFATALTTGFTFGPQTAGLSTMVKYNSTGTVTDFRVRYVSNSTVYGTDSISFSVSDPAHNLSSSTYATAIFNTTRIPTPPTSNNFTIFGYEQEWTQFAITAVSTNDISLPVYIVLDSVNIHGSFNQDTGSANVTWLAGTNSTNTIANGGSIIGYLQSALGFYSDPSTSPVGNFTYRVYEPQNDLISEPYTAQMIITHVNHPPTSATQTSRISKGQLLTLRLPASDPDVTDTDSTLTAAIVSVTPYNGGPPIFYDAALTQAVTSASIAAGQRLSDRTLYYQSKDLYDNTLPLMTYQFVVYDSTGASSDPYYGYLYVGPAGDVPVPSTNVSTTMQSTPVPMQLTSGVTTESGMTPTGAITSLPTKGTFTACADNGVCTDLTGVTLPYNLTSTTGRVVYTPRPFDWGDDFTTFTYTLTDPGTGAEGTYTMTINVVHVNQAPSIFAANFPTTTVSSTPLVINQSEWRTFDWYANDVDDLPATLNSSVSISFYTSQGFSIYACSYAVGAWNNSECAFTSADVPEAVRSDFAKNAQVSIQNFEVVSTDCSDADALKLRYGNTSRGCESHFRFAFVPSPMSYYTPYVSITWTVADPSGASSPGISALIAVKQVNQRPTISAPSRVVGVAGITNPFIRNTNQDSTSFENPITVGDVDSNGKAEQMTFSVVSGQGNFLFPANAPCVASSSSNSTYVCTDTISSFNKWLSDVRFNVTDGDTATLLFIINDLGNSGDYKPSPNLVANATTVVVVGAAATPPSGNSSTLAIAVGTAAGAGLLALGALGFLLRNAVSPPAEDYFSGGASSLNAAPQSPLYQAQNTEHLSPLYRANA